MKVRPVPNSVKMKGPVQLIKYGGVGGIAAVVEWTCFGMLVGTAHVFYLTAVVISFIAATATNYVLSSRLVFVRGRHSPFKEVFLLYLVSAAGLFFNLILMSLFVGFLGMHAMTAKIISTGLVFFWNYGARKTWVFEN
jgi:putative flippase GtrA